MDQDTAYQALCVLCDTVRQQSRKRFQTEVRTTRSGFISRGTFHSSMYVGAVEELALKVMEDGVAEMLDEVLRITEAGALNGDTLAQTFESRVRALASDLTGERDSTLNVAMSALNRDWRRLAIEKSLDQFVEHGVARIGVAISTAKNRSPASVTNNFNVHAPTGAIMVGNGNTANVTQSVVTEVSPGEVKAALDALIQALRQAQGVAPDQRAEVVEVLEQVKAEADKEKPNKVKLDGLIGGARKVLEGLKVGLDLFKTVEAWYAFISANAVVAAPVIEQALHQLKR